MSKQIHLFDRIIRLRVDINYYTIRRDKLDKLIKSLEKELNKYILRENLLKEKK